MPFKNLIRFMLGMVKESSRNALERFFPKLNEATHMSQQAFSLARQKLKWEAVEELFRASVEGSYNEEIKDWRGWLLMAVDGSRIVLPPDAELREYYGTTGNETAATAQASILYDIENDIIVDAKIGPLQENERSLAKKHADRLAVIGAWFEGRKAIVIFDRGYPSKDLIEHLE
ncbi:MAG: transposase, partial [Treponema sp.]|nr:transposase [Treponema sp.]